MKEEDQESFTSEWDSPPLNCFMTLLESVMPCDTTVLS